MARGYADDAVPMTSEVQLLPVQLTREEKLERGERIGTVMAELRKLDHKEARFKEALKEEREPLKMEAADLGDQLATGTERRPVRVDVYADHNRNVATFVRSDTGDVVKERELLPEERQAKLFPVGGRRRKAEAGEGVAP